MRGYLGLKTVLVAVLLGAACTGTAFAAATAGMADSAVSEGRAPDTAKGLIMLDYEVIPVPGDPSLDLLGAHYLHRINPWLYLGLGLHGPLVHGSYGGFMIVDATVHAQHRLFGQAFVDAGASVGGGGGGSSIQQSKLLSGTGGFVKGYVGLGYRFPGFSAGLNYSRFRFVHSRINHAQLDVFVQRPVSYTVGSFADAGRGIAPDVALPESGEDVLTLELNNMFRIKPKGSNRKTINLLSLQFSHFLTRNHYLFFEADVGYKGLPLYNQALGGIGYRYAPSPRFGLYGQLGVGSGGYSPPVIDTGPGLLVYPKLSAEYLLNNKLGLSVSAGYLFAPRGSSRNVTLGAAMNYHLSADGGEAGGAGSPRDRVYRGFRVHLFQQTEFDVRSGSRRLADIHMLSTQFDYIVNDHWYVPLQASVAYESVLGYPGYGEWLTGLGIQSGFSADHRLQGFVQMLVGANALDVVFKPSVGLDYSLSDHFALYAQFAKTLSFNKFDCISAGLGLSYRFSIPDTPLH